LSRIAFAVPVCAALIALAALPGAASAAADARAAAHPNSAAPPARTATVIPATTRVVAAADIASVTTSGPTLTITLGAAVRVAVGDIIVAGIGRATPDGLIAKVTGISGTTLTATSATLRQAAPQGSFSATATFTSVSSGKIARTLVCGAGGGTINVGGDATVTVRPAVSASWTAKSADVTISASAGGASESDANAIPPDYVCSTGAGLGAATTLPPFQVSAGALPVVVTPRLSWFVQSTVNTTGFVSAEVSQTFTASGSLTDNAGRYSVHGGASTGRASDIAGPPAFGRNLVSVSIGPAVTMGLFGGAGPTVRIGLGSTLDSSTTAVPWWTADATQQVTGTAAAPALSVSSATETLDGHSTVAAHGFTPKTGFSVYPTSGAQQGAVRGPGGQIWLIGYMPTQLQGGAAGSQALDEVSPVTGAVSYWAPLPPYLGSAAAPTLLAYDDGPPAFDGGGNAWMIATATTPAGAVSHYLVRYTPGPSTSRVYQLAPACGSPGGITAAGDGSVWLSCGLSGVIRVPASGVMQAFGLSGVSTVGHLAAGSGGSMWTVGYNRGHAAVGLVRFTPGGAQSFRAAPRGLTPLRLAADGSGRVVETAACGSGVCLESVAADGGLSRVGTLPGTVRGIWGPSMDAGGNVWLLVDGPASRTGQFFLRLTAANRIQTYPFTVPACGGSLLSAAGAPAGSADGSAWIESTSNCTFIGNTSTAYIGALVRFRP
jgi:hypothetical protein